MSPVSNQSPESLEVESYIKNGPDSLDQKMNAGWEQVQKSIDTVSLNPILGMLRSPRSTLRKIYEIEYPALWPVLILVSAGICHALNQYVMVSDRSIDSLYTGLIAGSIAAPLVGIVMAFLISVLGRMLGGAGTFKRVFLAWGWSSVPSLLILIVWGLRFAIVGPDYFEDNVIYETASGMANRSLMYLTAFSAILMIWQMCMTVIAVSESHGYGILKSLFTLFVIFFFLLALLSLV